MRVAELTRRIGRGLESRCRATVAWPTCAFVVLGLVGATAVGAPLGLPARDATEDDAALIALGRQLFFDPQLSASRTISCASCHSPAQAFTQNLARPLGHRGTELRRNAPSLLNVGYRTSLMADGRAAALAEQVWLPLLAADEMANATRARLIDRLRRGDYADLLREMSSAQAAELVGQALAAYQRNLVTADSAFDRWFYGGRTDAIDAAAKRGFRAFVQHRCNACHTFTNSHGHFTDDQFHDTGVPVREGVVDLGRAEVTGNPDHRYRFRTPSLRNVVATAPYMHDGSIPDLASAVAFYAGVGQQRRAGVDPLAMRSITPVDRADLVAFLRALSSAYRKD